MKWQIYYTDCRPAVVTRDTTPELVTRMELDADDQNVALESSDVDGHCGQR